MDLSRFSKNLTWTVIIKLASAGLAALFFIYLILLMVEIAAGMSFPVLPFRSYSLGWRIGLTLFWFVFWLVIYRAVGGSFFARKNKPDQDP